MPRAKTTVKRPAKGARVPEETPAQRKKRLEEEKKARVRK
jgi:hypothetical protein